MLDSIEIREVSVTKQTDGYVIAASWKTTSEGTPYQGPYELVLMNGETAVGSWNVGNSMSCKQKVDIELQKDISYRVKIGGSEGTVYSESVAVLFFGFETVRGNFDGSVLHLAWDFREDITFAGAYVVFARSVSPDGSVIIGRYGDNYLDIPIHMDAMKAGAAGTVKLIPYIEERSRGPEIKLHFLPWKVRLDGVASVREAADGVHVEILQSHDYETTWNGILQPELCLCYQGQEWISAFAAGTASGSSVTFTFFRKDVDAERLKRAEAALYTGSSEKIGDTVVTLSGRRADCTERIALGKTEAVSVMPTAAGTKIAWNYCGAGMPSHYELAFSDGGTQITAECSEVFAGRRTGTVSIRPYFGLRAGLPSSAASLHPAGYYLYQQDGKWHIYQSQGEESPHTLSCHIRQEIFNRRLAGSVEGNGITLAPEEGGYVLTVTNPSERKDADYEAFLTALFSVTENTTKEEPPQGETVLSVLPEFAGEIQDMVAQMADVAYEDLLLCACGYSGEDRCTDLKRGMRLLVEAEGYKPSYGADVSAGAGQYLPGYYMGATSVYQMHSYGSGEEWKLGFDAFLAGMKEEHTVQRIGGVLERQNGEGGLADLFRTGARKPLYRIHYPVRMQDSQEAGTDYAPGNVCLIGADTYGQLVEATASMNNEQQVTTAGVTLSYFRGRAVMVPKIPIVVDGVREYVSLGTTFENLLEEEGFDGEQSAGEVKLLRRSCMDKSGFLPVYFPENANDSGWRKLPLLPGDRISLGRARV